MPTVIDTIVSKPTIKTNYFCRAYNNLSEEWVDLEVISFSKNQSFLEYASNLDLVVVWNKDYLDEEVYSNPGKLLSVIELKVTITDYVSSVTKFVFYGYVDSAIVEGTRAQFTCVDPIQMLNDCKAHYDGSEATRVSLVNVVLSSNIEQGENRWIPLYGTYPSAWKEDPSGYPSGDWYKYRRQWHFISVLRWVNAKPGEWEAGDLVPLHKWFVGGDWRNYIQATSPTYHTEFSTYGIRLDDLIVYVEGTNEIEDIVVDLLSIPKNEGGPGWVDGIHFKTVAPNQTIFSSGLTVSVVSSIEENEMSILELIEKILEETAPPNYKLWFDHELKMVRLQFIEQYDPASPPEGDTYFKDYININKPISDRIEKDLSLFASRVVVQGIKELPENKISTVSDIVPGGFSKYGTTGDTIDRDSETFFLAYKTVDFSDDFYDYIKCDLGTVSTLQQFIVVAPVFSKILFDDMRIQVLASADDITYTFLHADLVDKYIKCGEKIELSSPFNIEKVRYIKIRMSRAANWQEDIGKFWGFGLAEVYVTTEVGEITVGEARIDDTVYADNPHYITENGRTVALVYMPLLYDQVVNNGHGHVTKAVENNSLTHTTTCADEAVQHLIEAVREYYRFTCETIPHLDAEVFRTCKFKDVMNQLEEYFLIEDVTLTERNCSVDGSFFSDTNWLGEALP